MHSDPDRCAGCAQQARLGRRRFLGLLGGGTVLALAGCAPAHTGVDGGGEPGHAADRVDRGADHAGHGGTAGVPTATPAPIVADPGGGPPVAAGVIPPPRPGQASVVSSGPAGTQQVALTIDDGYCGECIEGYVQFAQNAGIHITFNPNGVYQALWTPAIVSSVREMVANGQVQVGNHTWDHANLLPLSDAEVADEINRNEDWVAETFGVTTRPYFRPPYGYYDRRVMEVAGNLGYTSVLMWNGTFGDATVETADQLIALAEQWLQPGAIVLGHLNHPTVLSLFSRIEAIIAARDLESVTLDEMFGTSRVTG